MCVSDVSSLLEPVNGVFPFTVSYFTVTTDAALG